MLKTGLFMANHWNNQEPGFFDAETGDWQDHPAATGLEEQQEASQWEVKIRVKYPLPSTIFIKKR